MVSDFRNKNILIVGLGLMGGSIAKALKGKDTGDVWAFDKDESVLAQAKNDGVIDAGYTSSEEVIKKADFVVVCLYPKLAVDFINVNMQNFKSGAVITDICGVKKPIVQGIDINRKDIDFVPGHPMAGSERRGYDCSFPTLFEGCNYIITPLKTNSPESVNLVISFAETLGAKNIVKSTPEMHDECIAYTSQIPHALAVAYMHSSGNRDVVPYAGGSFRDVSRVAAINETMWAELFIQNREKLIGELEGLEDNLREIRELIGSMDTEALEQYMKRGSEIKEEYNAKNNG